MSEPTLNYVSCPDASGNHRMAYWQWGRADAPHVVLCVHGLSRQGRDFDVLAQALIARGGDGLRVVCPDVVGRGQSDWLQDPKGYQVPAYAADMGVLLQALQPATLDWVGTSMGGLIGLVLAGQAGLPFPIRRLVLNDVGPTISWPAIERIGAYLGAPLRFDSVEQAADALRLISTGFGPHTREQWLALTRPMLKPAPEGDGRLMLHYDPAIAIPFRALTPEASAQGEVLLWQLYDAIRARTLLLRGADSDLFSRETAQAMTRRGPHARLVEFPGVGHAPTLVAEDQVRVVSDFLLAA
ncbi:MAG: alpha/beta hydrolase [Burkholderiaceae bacterium]|nr:alpha/beta hydrolase [Burkholderiaceae bacterium]